MEIRTVRPAIPTSDIEKAKSFYADKVGLSVEEERPDGVMFAAGDSGFLLYPSGFAGTNQATSMAFHVADLDATIDEMNGRGITFEQYDLPGLKTDERGVVDFEGIRGAWFKDPDGNIVAIDER